MGSSVLELQSEAYHQGASISVLLRKAYVLSRKLKVTEFTQWAERELNGYGDEDLLPDYRVLNGELRAFNPYNGYIPAYFPKEIESMIKSRGVFQPLSVVETLVGQAEKGKGILVYKFPPDLQRKFMEMAEVDFEISLHISAALFRNITDRVRNIILDWTLKLEEEGVLGEGLTFSEAEKKKATEGSVSIINNIGTISHSQLQQNTDDSAQTLNIKAVDTQTLRSLITELHKLEAKLADEGLKRELRSDIAVLECQAESTRPKEGIIREALKSIRNLAEGCGGSLLASGIVQAISVYLGTPQV